MRLRALRGLTVATILSLSVSASAARVLVGGSTAFVGDASTITTGSGGDSTYYDVFAYFRPHSKWNLYLGFEYIASSYSGPNSAGVASAFSTDNAAVGLRYSFGKNEIFYAGAAFGVAANANYQTTGNSAEAWTGSSMIFQIGLRPELSKKLRLKAAVHYVSASYGSKTPAGATSPSSSVQSFTRTSYFPTLGIEYGF